MTYFNIPDFRKLQHLILDMTLFGYTDNSQVDRQKGLTTSHINIQLDPFASKLTG